LRQVGAGPHETLDRGIGKAIALPAGQLARGNERRRRCGAEPRSEQKAGDCVPQEMHAWDRSVHFQEQCPPPAEAESGFPSENATTQKMPERFLLPVYMKPP
jgi:hypothetical protein